MGDKIRISKLANNTSLPKTTARTVIDPPAYQQPSKHRRLMSANRTVVWVLIDFNLSALPALPALATA